MIFVQRPWFRAKCPWQNPGLMLNLKIYTLFWFQIGGPHVIRIQQTNRSGAQTLPVTGHSVCCFSASVGLDIFVAAWDFLIRSDFPSGFQNSHRRSERRRTVFFGMLWKFSSQHFLLPENSGKRAAQEANASRSLICASHSTLSTIPRFRVCYTT